MKKINLVLLLFSFIILAENTGCKKESVQPGNNAEQPGSNTNNPPIARAGSDVSIWGSVNSVQLNGTGSYDPDKDKITYKWAKISGRDGTTIVTPDSAITNVTNLEAGAYRFALTVTDSKGAEANAQVTVLVNSSYHIYVRVNPSDTMLGLSGGSVPLEASAVAQGGNNSHWSPAPSKVEWTKIFGPASYNFQSTNNLSTQVSGLGAGTYAFQCKFTDSAGITGYGCSVVSVVDSSPDQEMILPNQNWIGIAPLGGPEILASLAQLPADKAIKKVLVKQDCDSVFREASHFSNVTAGYRFGFSVWYNFNGLTTGLVLYLSPRDWNFFCWPATGEDTPDIKIIY